jgi:predicted DNA-binding transcriptional regulator AlpA
MAVRKGCPVDELALPSVDEVGRRIDSEQLVGAAEIASRLGVKRPQVVHDWRRRYEDFPEPVAHLRQALVWYWPDVDRWARATGRLGHSRDTRGPESAGTSGN